MRPIALAVLCAVLANSQDWPRFRGPNGTGIGEGAGLPVDFGPAKNVAWKTAVPFGRSSPIAIGNRIFVTASEANQLLTQAYDATTGRELWSHAIQPTRLQSIYKSNDPASPTPVSDGSNLYVYFADHGLLSFTLDGKQRWDHPLPRPTNFFGIGASPIVAGGLVVMLIDQPSGSYVIAVDAQTGKERWRRERPESPEGWSVPIVHNGQLLLVGTRRVDGYQLATGEPVWWIPLPSNGGMGTPVIHGDTLLVTATGMDQPWLPSFPSTLAKVDKNNDGQISLTEAKGEQEWFEFFGWLDANKDGEITAQEWETARQFGVGEYGAAAIPLNGKGKLPTSAIRWRLKRNLPYVPSALLYQGVLYLTKEGGIITSVNPETGAILKAGRTPKALGDYHSSPIAADGKIYATSVEGKLTVIQAGPQWSILAVNDLEDEVYATPAIHNGHLIVRTRGTLYSFGAN